MRKNPAEKGYLVCNKCHSQMVARTCKCGGTRCYITAYWKPSWGEGCMLDYRKDANGVSLTYETGMYALTLMRGQMANKTFNPNKFMKSAYEVETLLEQWIGDKKENDMDDHVVSEGYISLLRGYIDNHFVYFFTGMTIDEVDRDSLQLFKKTLKTQSVKTRRNILLAFHNFMRWCKREGKVENIPEFPTPPRSRDIKSHALTVELQDIGLGRIPERHRDVFLFGAETGLRSGELGALQVWDVNLLMATVTVRRTWIRGQKIQEHTKGKTEDTIPLSKEALRIVRKNMTGKQPTDFLFTNTKGQPYTPKRLYEIWKWFRGEEFKNITVHELLRHSFCTQMVEAGASGFQAQQLMRHKDIRTTEKYVHKRIEPLREFVDMRKKPNLRLVREGNED